MALACTRSEFISNGKCFTEAYFNEHEQLAIEVYRLAQIVDAFLGSATYAVAPFSTLYSAANDATCGLTDDQLQAGYIGVLNVSIPSGALAPTGAAAASLTQATAASGIACLKQYTRKQLMQMKTWLFCYWFALLGW